MEILHGNRVGLEPRHTKHGHKSHILFCGIPILCRLPSLWCPLTHLSITKLTVSYQTCSEWFHLPLWKLAMGTVAGWSHPGPKSHEVSWPTGRSYWSACSNIKGALSTQMNLTCIEKKIFGPVLQTWINLNPSMHNLLLPLWNVGWNYLYISKCQQCDRWSVGMDKYG